MDTPLIGGTKVLLACLCLASMRVRVCFNIEQTFFIFFVFFNAIVYNVLCTKQEYLINVLC